MSNFFLESVNHDSSKDNDTLTTLNDTNDLTRLAYQNKSGDIPLRNNSITDRFESDTFINHKESFEANNSRLNSLHDEIRELKEKLRIIPEKETKILELKCENDNLRLEIEELKRNQQSSLRESISLRSDNKSLQSRLQRLTEENEQLKKEIDDNDDNDEIRTEPSEEFVPVNIKAIKNILCSRLQSYHEKHIDELINSYELQDKKQIKKSIMQKLLVEAIHI
jgi:DNA repair exonuclease SbcCD ATPase subunit